LNVTCTRDDCLELLAVGAQCALHLQSLATDVIVFSQTPLGWTRYPSAFATGSSMMPNKSNPDAMELLRGECNKVIGAHHELVLVLKGLPSGYNRDLQCVKPVVHRGVETLVSLLRMSEAFVAGLAFDAEALSASLAQGNIAATFRMEAAVQDGVPLREAHHAVAGEAPREGGGDAVSPTDLDRYATIGSADPAEVRRVADVLEQSLRNS
jgi:argininosuccinate lyase